MCEKKFPSYAGHQNVDCFNCGADLYCEYFFKSGNAPGHGEFEVNCPKCGLWTWYDIDPIMTDWLWLCSACGQENTSEDACCTQCHKLYESDLDERIRESIQ